MSRRGSDVAEVDAPNLEFRNMIGAAGGRRSTVPRVRNAEAEMVRSARRRLAAATDSELTDDDVLALLIRRHLGALEEELKQEYLRGLTVVPAGGAGS